MIPGTHTLPGPVVRGIGPRGEAFSSTSLYRGGQDHEIGKSENEDYMYVVSLLSFPFFSIFFS